MDEPTKPANDPTASAASDWLNAQRKYWDAWMDLTRQTLAGKSPGGEQPTNVWAEALTQWWQAVSAAAPPASQDLYDKLIGLGKAYFAMGEKFAGGTDSGSQPIEQWLDGLQRMFTGAAEGFGTQADRGMRDVMAFWDLPLDTWQRTVSSMSPLPGDFMHALQTEGATRMAERVHERLDRFLSIPAVGYSREAQEQHQHLARLMLDYMKALQEYNLAFARVGARSTDRFRKKLGEASAGEAPVDSLRKLYDLWVDACEEVYADYVMSDEYTELYGRMVNALMAVKHHGAMLVDETLETMNMPTRREINTMHKRLQEVRRENRALRAELERLIERLDGGHPPASTASRRPARPRPKGAKH